MVRCNLTEKFVKGEEMKKYSKAKIEEIYFEETDVIKTSNGESKPSQDSNMDQSGWDIFD